jgi:hypothetical protein
MNATIDEVKEILEAAIWRAKSLDWEMQDRDEIPEDLLEALWNTQETIKLCKARLAQDGVD